MAIRGFFEERQAPPIGTIKIGCKIPTICKHSIIYAESPYTDKCVNVLDGECPMIKSCKAARCTVDQWEKSDGKTRPEKLPFFLIPDFLQVALKLPNRPTEIPGVVFVSDSITIEKDELGRESIHEPVEALERPPICRVANRYWTTNDLVCTSDDGEHAVWYKNSPTNPKYNQPRECCDEECPDYKSGKCKTDFELFFQIPNAPGFGGVWRLLTHSVKAGKNMIAELKSYHKGAHVSLIPMTLSLRPEKASPTITRDGQQTKVKTLVYRVHIIPMLTMAQLLESRRDAMRLLLGDSPTAAVKQLKSATLALPEPQPQDYIDTTEDDADDPAVDGSEDHTGAVQPPAQAATPKAAPPKKAAPAAAKPQQQAPPPPPTFTMPNPPNFDDPAEAGYVVREVIRRLLNCATQEQLDATIKQWRPTIGQYKRDGDYDTTELNKVLAKVQERFPEKPALIEKVISYIHHPQKNPEGPIPSIEAFLDGINQGRPQNNKAQRLSDLSIDELNEALRLIEESMG